MWNWSACAYNEIFPPISWQLSNSWWQGAWENRSPLLPPTAPDRTGRDKQGPHSAGYPEPSKHPYTAQHHGEPFAPTALCHLLQIQGNPHLRGHFCAAHHCVPRAVARLAPTLPSAIAIAFIYFLNYTVFPAPLNLIKLWPKILSQRREQKKCFCARTSITVILIITKKKPAKSLNTSGMGCRSSDCWAESGRALWACSPLEVLLRQDRCSWGHQEAAAEQGFP